MAARAGLEPGAPRGLTSRGPHLCQGYRPGLCHAHQDDILSHLASVRRTRHTMAIQPQLCTVAEFEDFLALPEHRDRFFELIHGEIVEKVPTEEHGLIAGNLCAFLWQYTRQSGIGRAVIEVRVQVPEDDYNSCQPDLAVFLDTTLPLFTRGPLLQL